MLREIDTAVARAGGRVVRDLTPTEIDELLRTMRWGVLATTAAEGPYAVPVAYGYDGSGFVVAMKDGRKARNLDRSLAVCLTVIDVTEPGVRWRSAVATGNAEWVTGFAERFAAFQMLRRHHGRLVLDTAAVLADRIAAARLLRIPAPVVTGRGLGV